MYGISYIIICMYIIRIISYVVSYSMSCYIFLEGIIAKLFLPPLQYQCKYWSISIEPLLQYPSFGFEGDIDPPPLRRPGEALTTRTPP